MHVAKEDGRQFWVGIYDSNMVLFRYTTTYLAPIVDKGRIKVEKELGMLQHESP